MRQILVIAVLFAGVLFFSFACCFGSNGRVQLRPVRVDEVNATALDASCVQDPKNGGAADNDPKTAFVVSIDQSENVRAYRFVFSIPRNSINGVSWRCLSTPPYCLVLDAHDRSKGEYRVSVAATGGDVINLGRGVDLASMTLRGALDKEAISCVSYEFIDCAYESHEFLVTDEGDFVPIVEEYSAEHDPEDDGEIMPDVVTFSPNPFNVRIEIALRLDGSQRITMSIYDVSGRLVKSLTNNELRSGIYRSSWDATDNKNKRVASGIYFCRLKIDDRTFNKKLMLVK